MATAKERYDQLSEFRTQFLHRARHNAMLTVPSLMPLEGHDGKSHLYEPYQSLGALGVVSLSSRIAMAMFPAGRPHLRFGIPPRVEVEDFPDGVPSEVDKDLGRAETLVQMKVEASRWRTATLEISQQLIVAGSTTVEFLNNQRLRIHRLDNFVWRRDARGLVLECIIREYWDKDNLPEGVPQPTQKPALSSGTDDDAIVFTWLRYVDGTYTMVKQTEDGTQVGESVSWLAEDVPFLFMRWASTPGEDYGRSKVEEVIGDLRSYDSMSKQALEHGAMGAMNFIMVRPGANANGLRNRISRRTNGDIIVGDPESVDVKQFANAPGFQITEATVQRLEERLSRAFLLLSTQQRNAERVTATEIERDIQELESTLGGTFSALSLDVETMTRLLIEDMKVKGEFPAIEEDRLQLTILTGLEALSRERDVGRGVQAAQIIGQFGPEALQRVKLDNILDKILVGLGFADSIKSQAEFERDIAAMQQAQLAEKAIGPAIQAASREGGGSNG